MARIILRAKCAHRYQRETDQDISSDRRKLLVLQVYIYELPALTWKQSEIIPYAAARDAEGGNLWVNGRACRTLRRAVGVGRGDGEETETRRGRMISRDRRQKARCKAKFKEQNTMRHSKWKSLKAYLLSVYRPQFKIGLSIETSWCWAWQINFPSVQEHITVQGNTVENSSQKASNLTLVANIRRSLKSQRKASLIRHYSNVFFSKFN